MQGNKHLFIPHKNVNLPKSCLKILSEKGLIAGNKFLNYFKQLLCVGVIQRIDIGFYDIILNILMNNIKQCFKKVFLLKTLSI